MPGPGLQTGAKRMHSCFPAQLSSRAPMLRELLFRYLMHVRQGLVGSGGEGARGGDHRVRDSQWDCDRGRQSPALWRCMAYTLWCLKEDGCVGLTQGARFRFPATRCFLNTSCEPGPASAHQIYAVAEL